MSDDRMQGPRAKIERAKQHVGDLEAEIRRFLDSGPYEVIADEQSEPGYRIYKLSKVVDPPYQIALIAGDAVHNARSSLDLLVRQLVLANGKTPSKRDAFPISESSQGFKSGGAPKIKGRISNDAVKVVRAVKPYKGGNDALWRLHHLDIADKHHLLSVVGARFEGVTIPMSRPPAPWITDEIWNAMVQAASQIYLQPPDRMFPLKDGDVLMRNEIGELDPDYHPQFRFGIAFGQGEVVQGEPVLETINQLIGAAEEVVELFAGLL
jgi:hypothetical protein